MSPRALLLALSLAACGPKPDIDLDEDDEADEDDGGGGEDALDLVGILVTPEDLVLPVGGEAQLRAIGLLAERESVDLTASVSWTVDGAAATVSDDLDEEGLLRATGTGVVEVAAVYGDLASPPVRVQVTDAALERLTVAPARLDLAAGDETRLVATARFSDGSSGDFSAQVLWRTGDPSVVRIADAGQVTAVGEGETTVRASFEDLDSDTVPVSVEGVAAPDLVVSAASGEIVGGMLELAVTVRNAGTTGASGFWVDVFVDPDGAPEVGDFGDDWQLVEYVGAASTASLTYQIPAPSGSHEVVVFVDSNDEIEEADETNNTFQVDLSSGAGGSGPNLEITFFEFLSDATSIAWFVDVTNTGDQDADWFYVDLFIDQSWSPEVYDDGDEYTSIDGIAAGDTDYADFVVETACAACLSWVMVDGYDLVAETDESDNVAGPLSVTSD